MPDCAPTHMSKPIPGICGRGDGDSRGFSITPSVRPQSPTGRHAPVSVKDTTRAHPVSLLPNAPADRVPVVIDDCWHQGMGVGPARKAVKRRAAVFPDFELVRSRFAALADAYCSGPP